MALAPGDDLIFQLESAFGLLRVLAVEGEGAGTIWHLLAYDDFFPDVESAEAALSRPTPLPVRKAHMALTNRAFERTLVARDEILGDACGRDARQIRATCRHRERQRGGRLDELAA